jgi:hypothetical protein
MEPDEEHWFCDVHVLRHVDDPGGWEHGDVILLCVRCNLPTTGRWHGEPMHRACASATAQARRARERERRGAYARQGA